MPNRAIRTTALLLLATSQACRTSSPLRSTAPSLEPSSERGLRYYVPRDVLVIEGTATFNLGKGWSKGSACAAGEERAALKSVSTAVTPTTIPDRRTAYHLTMGSSQTVAQNLKLAMTPDGLLTSMSYSLEDKRAAIAGNVLRSVAGIAGAALGGAAMLGLQFPPKAPESVKGLEHPNLSRNQAEKCALEKDPRTMSRLLQSREQLEEELPRAIEERETALQATTTAHTSTTLAFIGTRDELLARRVAILSTRLNAIQDSIWASVSKNNLTLGVTAKDTVIRLSAVLDLDSIPGDTITPKLTSVAKADTVLSGYAGVRRLLESLRVVLTIQEPSVAGKQPVSTDTATRKRECVDGTATNRCVHIYTRLPHPRILRVYVPSSADASSPFRLQSTYLLSLISSRDTVIDVPISTRTLGQKSFALVFSRPGSLAGFESSSSAGLATATSTLADALSASRQELVSGLQTAQTVQSTLDAIRSESRTSRLKELQDEKTLIDAQVALQGAEASEALVLQKQQIDAQIALLNSQQTLASSEQSGAVASDVAALRAQMQQLQAQLDLLKVQMEIAKAKKASESP